MHKINPSCIVLLSEGKPPTSWKYRRSTRLVLCILLCITSFALIAQNKTVHSREQLWFGYFNQTRITNKFGLWMDVHYRLTDNFIERPFQLIIRPALNFYIKDNVRLQTGYAYVAHFPAKGMETTRPEHRPWQQIWWNQKYNGFTTLQWLRLEERFTGIVVNDELQSGYNFNYRLRYNFSFFIPLKGKELVPKTPFIALIDEVFINFGNKIVYNTFDQNRFFIGVGYQITSHMNVQTGYMNIFQQEATGNSYWSTHAIRLFLFQTLDFRNKEE